MLRQHPDPFSVSAERDPMPPVPGGGVHDGQDPAGQLHRGEFSLGHGLLSPHASAGLTLS